MLERRSMRNLKLQSETKLFPNIGFTITFTKNTTKEDLADTIGTPLA